MYSRVLSCAICALLVSPAGAQHLVIQDGDHYGRLQFMGESILMTGGQVGEMDLYVGQVRIEGGSVGDITTAGGQFDFSGGDLSGYLYCWRFSAGANFEGYSFRARRYENPIKDTYWYVVEGVLADGNFVSMSLLAASDNGAGVGLDFTFVGDFIPGDTDGDLDVDLVDLNAVRNNFGAETSERIDGDLDGNGSVGLEDLNEVRNRFGTSAPFTLGPEFDVQTNPVPEPSTGVLALFAAVLAISFRKSAMVCRSRAADSDHGPAPFDRAGPRDALE